jgi:KaiC/GvpD/RAD55 family RecA-like ATPase
MLAKARAFRTQNKVHCFFIGGNSGAGKTHLCSALAIDYLRHGSEVKYILWRKELREIRRKIFDEGNAVDIKGYIAKCRFFVAARTHASIAAYSNCIPTLVVGYSVKSTGIAKDLFGTDEGYVIPVQNLTDREALVKAFKGIMENEDSIRAGLTEIMPGYIEQARAVGKEIRALLGESDA